MSDMDNVKKALIFCLKRDVNLLNQTASDLTSDISKNIPNFSNAFIQNYQYVSSFNCSENLYIEYLEVLINRLYQILYLTNYCYIDKDKRQKNVVKPQVPSLGSLVTNLMLHLQCMNVNYEKRTNSIMGATKGVQTETKTLEKCDSCFEATSCIKKIVSYFEAYGDNSFICREKKRLHEEDLMNVTQQGVMRRIASCIENDIVDLFKSIDSKIEESQQYKNESKMLIDELQSKNELYNLLKIERNTLHNELNKYQHKIDFLTKEVRSYETVNKEYRKQVWIMNQLVGDLNENISTLKLEKTVYLHNKEIQDEKIANMVQEGKIIREKVSTFNEKLEQYENDFWDCIKVMEYLGDTVITKLVRTIEDIGNNCEKLESRLTNSIEKNSLSNYIQDLFKKCQDVINATEISVIMNMQYSKKLHKKEDVDTPAPTTSNTKLQGDPLLDMTKKLEENKKQIMVLETENKKLESITKKLTQLKNIRYENSRKCHSTNT